MHTENKNYKYKLAVIIPFYNENARVSAESFTCFAKMHPDILLVLVNDGSTDNTAVVLNSVHNSLPENTIVVHQPVNTGKGNAVRSGMLKIIDSATPFIAYMDADLSAPFEEILRLYDLIKNSEYDAVFGSRIKNKGSEIKRTFFRHISGRMIARLIELLFRTGCHDTQCSAKIFRSEILLPVIQQPFFTRWFFDVELILRIRKQTGRFNALETPVKNWEHKPGSKINAFSVFSVLKEIYTLTRKY